MSPPVIYGETIMSEKQANIIIIQNFGKQGISPAELGPDFIYVGRSYRKMMPYSPLRQPYYAQHLPYRAWLWEEIKRRNPKVMNLLRTITEQTILIDDQYPNGANARTVFKAAMWVQASMKAGQPKRQHQNALVTAAA